MQILGAHFLLSRKILSLLIGGFFVLCQVIGTMCALADLPAVQETATLATDADPAVCPMEGTTRCPPSVASSPKRYVNDSRDLNTDHAPFPIGLVAVPTPSPVPSPLFWSSAFSIVPVSIGSSSVLRI
jgi:hypothetical protein